MSAAQLSSSTPLGEGTTRLQLHSTPPASRGLSSHSLGSLPRAAPAAGRKPVAGRTQAALPAAEPRRHLQEAARHRRPPAAALRHRQGVPRRLQAGAPRTGKPRRGRQAGRRSQAPRPRPGRHPRHVRQGRRRREWPQAAPQRGWEELSVSSLLSTLECYAKCQPVPPGTDPHTSPTPATSACQQACLCPPPTRLQSQQAHPGIGRLRGTA